MKVKIVKCSRRGVYSQLIGKIVEVDEWNDLYYTCKPDDGWCFIKKADTVPVNEINQTVQCSWQDKMDSKSIAVRFENTEQREAIFKKFKNKGLDIYSIPSEFVKGDIGYSYCGNYVCVLSEIGLRGKKVISYEEFMGGSKEMKRLDIRKDYDDGKIIITRKEHKDHYALVRMLNYSYDVVLKIGKNYNFTLDRANAILKIMELDYEIYESTEWSDVEDGTEVAFKSNSVAFEDMVYKTNCKFHSYIPNLKKIVLIVGEEVKVVDEDRVELV